MDSTLFIIGASLIVIVSFGFNLVAKKTNIPSVLLLIGLGILLQKVLPTMGLDNINLMPLLEVMGLSGLVFIVLEAAIDLEITKEKRGLINSSLLSAFVLLLINSFLIAFLFKWYMQTDMFVSLVHAIPFAIISSAIVLPSVNNLATEKREFLIYESAFSDILGIMFFYFVIESAHMNSAVAIAGSLVFNVIVTLVVSALSAFILLNMFQKITSEARLFFIIAILFLLYALGKLFHLSSLLLILVFGLIVENRHIIFTGKLRQLFKPESVDEVYRELRIITVESSFVIRTFFFVIFGLTISLSLLLNPTTILISLAIIVIIFAVRLLYFRIFLPGKITLEALVTPRGLITLLLFFTIPQEYRIEEFSDGILLYVILVTSLIMGIALIFNGKKKKVTNDNGIAPAIEPLNHDGEI